MAFSSSDKERNWLLQKAIETNQSTLSRASSPTNRQQGIGNRPEQAETPLSEATAKAAARTAHASADRVVTSAADTQGTGAVIRSSIQDTSITVGEIVFSLPYMHHYKVQIGGGAQPYQDAILLNNSPSVPLGSRESSLLPAGTSVCLLKIPGFSYHVILGSIPAQCTNDKYNVAQILQLGGNASVRKQDGYCELFNVLQDGGDINHFGAARPLDGNIFEYSISTETGVSLLLDPYQVALSINESCGLFLNWWDSYTKLTGFSLDIESYTEHIRQRYDEGENVYIRGHITYPWEATGNYKYGTDFTTENEASDYQTKKDKPYGYYDLPEGEEDLAPIYRYMEYGGYLGQGYTRMLMKPAKESGKRKYSENNDPDYGLWQESVALDGSYTMRSAKSIYIGKYLLIPVPKRKKMMEDQKDGDDLRKSNYRFSNEFGGDKTHKVKDITVEGATRNLLRVSGVLDLLTYNYNWKSTHPFYYHENDYKFWEESKLEDLKKAQAKLNYGSMTSAPFGYLKEPESEELKIDERYNNVEYFQSMSYLTFLEDGGIALGDGYGSQLTMTGGKISLEAPGDIMIMPGAKAITFCDEMFVRARNNIEFSSSNKDVRLKAQKNMQLLSGNGGEGGMLIQNKGSGAAKHEYKGNYGDEVKDAGITLLAKNSEVGVLSHSVYIRGGADPSSSEDPSPPNPSVSHDASKGDLPLGDYSVPTTKDSLPITTASITLDAGQGEAPIQCYSKTFSFFNSQGVHMWHAPKGKDGGNFEASHMFAKNTSIIGGSLMVKKGVCVSDGSIIVRKGLFTEGSVMAGGSVGTKGKNQHLVDMSTAIPKIASALDKCDEGFNKHKDLGEPYWEGAIKGQYYDPESALGNETLFNTNMGFSFNDRPNAVGYGLKDTWGLLEARWQQYVRLELASGGSGWTESAVTYQGNQLYPYPGNKLWTGDKFQQIEELTMYDAKEGYATDRKGGKYEEPKLSKFEKEKADGTYKLIP